MVGWVCAWMRATRLSVPILSLYSFRYPNFEPGEGDIASTVSDTNGMRSSCENFLISKQANTWSPFKMEGFRYWSTYQPRRRNQFLKSWQTYLTMHLWFFI